MMRSPRGEHFHDTIYERRPFFFFFFLPDLTNGLSTTTFLYSRSFHLYWTSSLYMYYKKKKICLNNKALPQFYNIPCIHYPPPLYSPRTGQDVAAVTTFTSYEYQWNHLKNVYTSFFTIWTWTFDFDFFFFTRLRTWHKIVCSPSHTGRENWIFFYFFLVCVRCCGWRWS